MCKGSERGFWKKFCFWMIVLLYISSRQLCAQAEVNQSAVDSLSNLLRQEETPGKKIMILKNLINLYWQHPEEVTYLKVIIDLSAQVDSFKTVYEGMAGLCRYYYNDDQVDSLLYWRNQLDSLSLSRDETPEGLFKVGYLLCRKYLIDKNYELAMNEALRLLNRAEKDKHEFGMMSASQDLGLVYQSVGRDDEAMKNFWKGLNWINSNMNRPSTKLQYLADMLVSSLRSDDYDKSLSLLRKYEGIFNEEDSTFKAMGLMFPMQWHRCLIDCYYTELYTKNNLLTKAKLHLEKAALESEIEQDQEVLFIYYKAASAYYQKAKENELALQVIDKALAIDSDLVVVKRKVEVLKAAGSFNEALTLYDDLLKKNSLVSNEAFLRQMVQLQHLNDQNEKVKRESELKHQGDQIAVNQRLFLLSAFFALVLLISLYLLYRYYKRMNLFKNELQEEKNALVESGKELQVMKEAAEDANRKKTAFIANISHEVRTPLNAIVGFSELLAEGNWDAADKDAFSSTINLNGELLMNLINDVLDLSRLESGNNRFSATPLEIVAFCEEMLDEVRRRALPGVEVTFTSPFETYELISDPYRLKQLLGKLLLNAAKFTKTGEINLAYELHKEECAIWFIVTDTGCGIPLDKQDLIFERFEKLDDFVQGTGLGLPICRMIAKQFGGSLIVDPTYTKGTRFIFTHPVN